MPYPVHGLHIRQIEVLTKGDNNRVDDRGLYAPGQRWLQREDIVGTDMLYINVIYMYMIYICMLYICICYTCVYAHLCMYG